MMLHQCLGDRYEAEAIDYFTCDAGVLDWLDHLSEAEMESGIAADENNGDDYEDYLSEVYSELAELYESKPLD